jgi:pimeloyl-ACP methyl ester carboxylesterase
MTAKRPLAETEEQSDKAAIDSLKTNIDGVNLHYLKAGSGPSVILLHGYTQTSHMWRPLIPTLSRKFTVIAPDLPGIGDSDTPAEGADVSRSAVLLRKLAKSLDAGKVRVVGHDIGLMVAYAYAAQFTKETEKLVLMDAPLPGIYGWEEAFNEPDWHLRFHGPTPEALVKGRERIYFEHYWNDFAFDKSHSIPEEDRTAYTTAYSRPGRMHSGWGYFSTFSKTAGENRRFAKTKLRIPVLVIGGEKGNGPLLSKQVKLVAASPTVILFKDTGHWVTEERPKETMDALMKFL